MKMRAIMSACCVFLVGCAQVPTYVDRSLGKPVDVLQMRITKVDFQSEHLRRVLPFVASSARNSDNRELPLSLICDKTTFGPTFTMRTNDVALSEVLEEIARQTPCVCIATNDALFVGSRSNVTRITSTPYLGIPEDEGLANLLEERITISTCYGNPYDFLGSITWGAGIPVDAWQTTIQKNFVSVDLHGMELRNFVWWYTALCTDGVPDFLGKAVWIHGHRAQPSPGAYPRKPADGLTGNAQE